MNNKTDFDVICVGLSVVDIFINPVPEDIMSKNEYQTSQIGTGAGGDAVNEAIMLKKLGVDTALMARIGADDMGELLLRHLKEADVNTSLVTKSSESVTATSVILVKNDGQRSILSLKGNNHDFCRRDIEDKMPLAKTKALSIASLFGLPTLEQDGGLLELLKGAKEKNIITFADMGMDKKGKKLDGIRAFLPYIDYFVPSLYEAEGLTDSSLSADEMADIFHNCGAGNVIIKLGENGVYASDGKTGKTIPSFRVDTIDTTGAGDTFCAGLIRSVIRGLGLFGACRFACAAAAFSTQYLGASSAPLTEEAAKKLMEK